MDINATQSRHVAPASALFVALCFATSVACHAQAAPPKSSSQQAPETVSVTAKPSAPAREANPGAEFSKLGGDIARAPLPTPAGATSILQLSAPRGSSGAESILVHLYQRNQALFLDILTARGKQAATRRNTVRLLSPLPDHPEDLQVSMRYLAPAKRQGLMLVASDPAMHYVLAFPKGLGGSVTQQQFLATSKTGTQSVYRFGDLDSRGFAIIKATVVSAEGGKPGDTQQYFVWNGSRFIPRAEN